MEAVFMNLSDTPKELFKKCSQLQEFRWIHGSCDFSQEFLTKNYKLKTFVYVQSKKTCKNGTNIHEKDILNAPMLEHLTIKNTNLNYNKLILDLSSKFKKLKILNLQNNNITHFENRDYFQKLNTIDLSGNPLKCDCDIISEIKNLELTKFNISFLTKLEVEMWDVDQLFGQRPNSLILPEKLLCQGKNLTYFEDVNKECVTEFQTKISIIISSISVLLIVLILIFVYKCTYMHKTGSNFRKYKKDIFIMVHDNDYDILAEILEKLNNDTSENNSNLDVAYELRDFEIGKNDSEQLKYFLKISRKIIIIISKDFLYSNTRIEDFKEAIVDHYDRYDGSFYIRIG